MRELSGGQVLGSNGREACERVKGRGWCEEKMGGGGMVEVVFSRDHIAIERLCSKFCIVN